MTANALDIYSPKKHRTLNLFGLAWGYATNGRLWYVSVDYLCGAPCDDRKYMQTSLLSGHTRISRVAASCAPDCTSCRRFHKQSSLYLERISRVIECLRKSKLLQNSKVQTLTT